MINENRKKCMERKEPKKTKLCDLNVCDLLILVLDPSRTLLVLTG